MANTQRTWHQFYDEGIPPALDFETLPLSAFLERSAQDHGDATALIFLNSRLTYRQLRDDQLPLANTQRTWHQFYDEGIPPALDFETLPLSAFLERSAQDHGDATALIFLNSRLTYRQLRDDVDRFATVLAGLGVTSGTRVAIQLPNLPQTVIAFYAVLRVLPSSSVGEESLSPNHPDTSSRF